MVREASRFYFLVKTNKNGLKYVIGRPRPYPFLGLRVGREVIDWKDVEYVVRVPQKKVEEIVELCDALDEREFVKAVRDILDLPFIPAHVVVLRDSDIGYTILIYYGGREELGFSEAVEALEVGA
ncbi:hypothetical protein [Pyrococcus kukulkanii]|uniref:hypothetical protein n=1 Tax=Pyrococcus kukulkanii TaxID=1609559 RepID=UPI003565B95F